MILRNLFQSILFLNLFFSGALNANESEAVIRTMSFNIRFGSANDGENSWPKRKNLVVKTIRDYQPDLFGLQESIDFQTEFVASHFPEFTHLGASREVDPKKGEGVPIFYRKDRFELIDHGDFWLSENPEQRGSKGWDAACPRIVTWAKLKDRKYHDRLVVVANTHFDHRGKLARTNSATLLSKYINSWKQDTSAIILMGDFNTPPGSPPHQTLLESELTDSYAKNTDKFQSTFSFWDGRKQGKRIDWILHGAGFETVTASINRYNQAGRYPSDHYPVDAELRFSK